MTLVASILHYAEETGGRHQHPADLCYRASSLNPDRHPRRERARLIRTSWLMCASWAVPCVTMVTLTSLCWCGYLCLKYFGPEGEKKRPKRVKFTFTGSIKIDLTAARYDALNGESIIPLSSVQSNFSTA